MESWGGPISSQRRRNLGRFLFKIEETQIFRVSHSKLKNKLNLGILLFEINEKKGILGGSCLQSKEKRNLEGFLSKIKDKPESWSCLKIKESGITGFPFEKTKTESWGFLYEIQEKTKSLRTPIANRRNTEIVVFSYLKTKKNGILVIFCSN